MMIAYCYFVRLSNGKTMVLAVPPEGSEVLEIRQVLNPDIGMVLRHKETGEISSGHWMRGEDSADKWEEIEEPKEVE